MNYVLSIFLFAFSLPALSQQIGKSHQGPEDFFVFKTERNFKKISFSAEPEDCRANIAKVVCLTDKMVTDHDPAKRFCEEGGAAYATYFEQLYDHSPPVIQKMFCSLDYLFIEKSFEGTAYAGAIKNPAGESIGALMGIRKSVLDEALNLSTWASWKEQLSFGGINDSYTLTPSLPQITTVSNPGVSDFLYFVVAHEFGHIFDFANKLNATSNCKNPGEDEPECNFAEGSWGALTWATNKIPTKENDYAHRNQLCFYWCKDQFITSSETAEFFAGLQASAFLSTYASSNPWDDFADSLAYYLMDQNLNTTYVIDTKQGANHDIIKKMKSPIFAPKHKYIQNFLSRTDIIYP